MEGRRSLAFASLDEIMPEVDRLLPGHKPLGAWSLGQVCRHLADTLRFSIEGDSTRAPWPIRMVVGPILRRKILVAGVFPAGLPIPGKRPPRPGLDDRAEAEALRAAVRFYSAHPGPFVPHPVMGGLTGEQWRRLQCVHAAHHLGFFLPETA